MYFSLSSQKLYIHEKICVHSPTVQYNKSHQLSNSSMVRGLSRDPEGLVKEEDHDRKKEVGKEVNGKVCIRSG